MWDSTIGSHGGFMNTTTDGASPTKAKEPAQRLQSVVPVCIRQIRDHPEDEFKLFGMQTQIVTLVGVLKEYEVQSTKATYQIEDHTGTISAIWWLESEASNAPNLPLVKEGCYVRVYGSLRVHEGQKLLMVLRMFPVDNINEVTTHLLEVVHARLEAENLIKGNESVSRVKMNNPGSDLAHSMSFIDDDQSTSNNGLSGLQQKVYNLLKSSTGPNGMHTRELFSHFNNNQHRAVRAAIEFLQNEGHAYSTVDNDHFKVTVSM